MKISDELKLKIEKAFPYNKELVNKLLSGDVDAIRSIGIMSGKGIDPIDVIESYENKSMDYLYRKAKKMIDLQALYEELCDAYVDDKLNSKKNYERWFYARTWR